MFVRATVLPAAAPPVAAPRRAASLALGALLALGGVLAGPTHVRAEGATDVAAAADRAAAPPARVVELFTSHGCSSCPPADALLGRLIDDDPTLVALEYHVDYWNSLVHGAAGNFVDPFSDAAWTERQRAYGVLPLGGRTGTYTPQAIVDGRYAAVGSDAARLTRALASTPPPAPDIRVVRDGDELVVHVSGVASGERETRTHAIPAAPVPDTGEIALVRFLKTRTTSIDGGENRGRELVNHRVVIAIEPLGRIDADGALTARAAPPANPDEGCAVLVRHGDDVPRLAGRLCPDPA